MLQDLIALVERYEPGYSRKIKGAQPAEIQQLEQLVGRPLPSCYREFLVLMGRDMGSLQIEEVNFQIDRVIKFYASGHWTPPEGYILFGVEKGDPCLDYYLECMAPQAEDCPVVRFPSEGEFSREEYFYPLDPSLKDFLLAHAFSEKRMEAFSFDKLLKPSHRERPGSNLVTRPSEIARLINERARSLGFEPMPQSSVVYHFFDHEDAALFMRLDESSSSLGLTIAARTAAGLARISDILSSGTSLVEF